MSDKFILTQERNPFALESLPLAGRIYCLRKGDKNYLSLFWRFIRMLIPGRPILTWLMKILGEGKAGTFIYEKGTQQTKIFFRVLNTQFHALYFPEYKIGYERETSLFIEHCLKENPNAVFYDVGANWGYFSLYAASVPNFSGKVFAFEPTPETFGDLISCVAQSHTNNLIQTLKIGLSDCKQSSFISLPDGLHSGMATVNDEKGIPIELKKMDDLNLPLPNIIKIDVEGLELKVILGGEKVIKQSRPKIIFENWFDENNSDANQEIFKVLESWGYDFFEPQLEEQAGGTKLHLRPFKKEERGELAKQINVIAL